MKAQIQKLRESKGFRKYFANTSYLMGGKLAQMAVTFLITAYVARYLGPDGFGTLNYGKAIVQFLILFVGLGMNGINVRNLVSNPENRDIIMGAAIGIRMASALFFTLVATTGIWFLPEETHDSVTNSLVFVMAFSLLFRPLDTLDEYFQSQVKARFGVYSRGISTFVFAAIQLYMILIKAEIFWFGVAFTIRNALMSISYLFFYVRQFGWPNYLKMDVPYMKELIRDAWPMVISSMVIFFYMKADQLMLWNLVPGDGLSPKESVGQYTAALRLSEVWFMFGPIITGSLFPAIINARKKSMELYFQRLQSFFDLMVWLAFAITIPMVLFGPTVLQWDLLFGPRYAAAGGVLVIHSWTLVFVFLGNASNNYLIAENLQKLTLYRTLIGASVNILLNLYLIPRYGIKGAAFATLVSQAIASYLSYGLSKKTHKVFGMMTRSLFLVSLFQKLKKKTAS